MASPEYKLSAVLFGHSMDVRCVATTSDSNILSASRDRTAKLWHPEGNKSYVNSVTYKGHRNFVSCICWLPSCMMFPDGLVVTGSNDNTILGYSTQDAVIQITLKGHENAVCSVAAGLESGILLSSSWDNTARVWNVNTPQAPPVVLRGHEAAVWSAIELNYNIYATASADKTIKMWKSDGTLIRTVKGHTDCVRGLAMMDSSSFLSCSNDATVKLWSSMGECMNTYYGHSNYIYSICIDPIAPQGFITSGEDGSVRIWVLGKCVRTLRLPAQSVWSVACLANGDVVTGSSDGVVRVFTKEPGRFAEEQVLKEYQEEVSKLQDANEQEIGGFKLSELPGPEALLEPGNSEGQTKLVRRGAIVKCYSWSVTQNTWNEIGDVLGAKPPTEGKTMYQGKEYDFVFSVDIKDGEPPLKLPFNKTEDPWVAAQAFIHRHLLPQVYLEQVANFIVTNAKLGSNPPTADTGYADPFTGESRYVPGSAPAAPSAAAADPFTGSGAYTTAAGSAASAATADTAGSAATTASASEKPLVPHDSYIRFDQANLKVIHDKLKEFNSKIGDGINPLSDEQLESIVKLGEVDNTPSTETVELLKSMLEWPKEILFPVLDIVRLAIRNKAVNAQVFDSTFGPVFVKFLLKLLTPDNLPANQMLALRVLVNAFCALPGEMLVLAAKESVLHSYITLHRVTNNTQIAAVSLLLNLSVALAQQADNADLADCVICYMERLTDNEAYFRALVAVGTLIAESPKKVLIQAMLKIHTRLYNRLKIDSSNMPIEPGLRKIAIVSQQIMKLIASIDE